LSRKSTEGKRRLNPSKPALFFGENNQEATREQQETTTAN